MTLDELYKKYSVLDLGLSRIYKIEVDNEHPSVDFSTPYSLTLNELYLSDKTWMDLVRKLILYLQNIYHIDRKNLLSLRNVWTTYYYFSENEQVRSFKIEDGLFFIPGNMSSRHYVFLIKDLLDLYGIEYDKCSLYVIKPTAKEPKAIVDLVEKNTIEGLIDYLQTEKGLTEERALRVIDVLKSINRILPKTNTKYDNVFASDPDHYSMNKSRLMTNHHLYVSWTDKQIKLAKRCLDYLTDYYRYKKENY